MRDGSVAGQAPNANSGDVAQTQDASVDCFENDLREIVWRRNGALASNDEGLLAFRNTTCTVVAIVVLDCADDIGDPETCGRELRPIGNHFEGSYEATQGIHVRDAGNGAQCRPDGPIEQAAAFLKREVAAFNCEHENVR